MTISSVMEAWSRRASNDESEDGQKYRFGVSTGYQVVHAYDTTEMEILSHTDVPQLGDSYQGTYALCRRRSVSKVGQLLSIVACEFSGETGPDGPTDNPLNTPAEYYWTSTKTTEAIDVDVYGNPIVTANGEEINGVTMEFCDSILNFKKNFSVFTNSTKQAYLHSVNVDPILIDDDVFLPGTGKMQTLDIKPMRLGSLQYKEVSGSIQFRYPYNTTPALAWASRIRHEGFYERLGPVVSFSGGGGSGAEAVAFANSSGVLTGIFVTKGGSGYTSNPTVSVSSGSGATFSVTRGGYNGDEVFSVAVTAGGTGYKVRIVRAYDSNGEPLVKPVLLTSTGFRTTPNLTAWVNVQKYAPLPYSILGIA